MQNIRGYTNNFYSLGSNQWSALAVPAAPGRLSLCDKAEIRRKQFPRGILARMSGVSATMLYEETAPVEFQLNWAFSKRVLHAAAKSLQRRPVDRTSLLIGCWLFACDAAWLRGMDAV